ncbi:MAG: DUF4105 domain-containing protein [Phycisphaerales bacterium]
MKNANSERPRPSAPIRLGKVLVIALAAVLVVVAYAWGCGALWWSPLRPAWLRGTALAILLVVGLAIALRCRGASRWALLAALWLVPFAWFWYAPATNDADWTPPTRVAPIIEVDGDRFTVRSVRDFHWRSEDDFDERWEEQRYDLSKLRTLDLFLSYWGPTLICHTFVSFGFEDGRHLAISVEVRKKKGEAYATVPSLFRQFELVYVFAEERDIVGVRTNVRKETVHLFRLQAPPAGIRGLLVEYIDRANRLAAHPEWYNAVTNSCGINIIQNAWAGGSSRPISWRLLFNGQWPRYAYENGQLDSSQPFDVIFARSVINPAAERAGYSPEFSQAIREGVIETYTVPEKYDPTRAPELPTGYRP